MRAAEEHLRAGGAKEVRTVAADVTDRDALATAVAQASRGMGGLDLLICSAAAIAFGRFTEVSSEDFDATIETVFGGTVEAIRLALPELEGNGGSIVLIGSIAGRMPLPTFSAYTAAKHAVTGFAEALRIELAEAGSPVTVSLVQPGPIDTPLWSNLEAAGGLLPPAPPDLYSPGEVAEAVAAAVQRPRPETIVGGFATLQVAAYEGLRRPTEWALKGLARLALASGDRPAGEGALRGPRGAGQTEGGFGGRASLTGSARRALGRARRVIGAV